MTRSIIGSGVKILNWDGFSLDPGERINEYGESNSVAGLATVTIVNYTVPVGKKLSVRAASASGENKAVFDLQIDNITVARERSYFTEYNVKFEIELDLAAGDNLKIVVENKRSSTADFNANFSGILTDV